MPAAQTLSSSLEDYLETIFHLVEENHVARAKDIARHLGVKSSSVTGALQALAKRELINYTPYDVITITPKGEACARDIVRRHEGLKDFFVKVLAVDEEPADEAACKMEHVIPRELLDRFIEFVKFVDECPLTSGNWVDRFPEYLEHGVRPEDCERYLAQCLEELHAVSGHGPPGGESA